MYLSFHHFTALAAVLPRTRSHVAMRFHHILLSSLLVTSSLAAPSAPQWRFDVKNTTSGVLALEAIVVSPSLVVIFDREYTVDQFILD